MGESDHMSRITEEHLAELQKQHGRVKHVVYNGVDLVFRRPKRVECQQHAVKLDNPQEKAVADEQLAQLLVVQCGEKVGPDAKVSFLALLDEYPYLTKNPKIGGALAKLTGVVEEEEVKS